MVIWDWCRCVSLSFEALNSFLECVTIYFHRLPYVLPVMLQYLFGSFIPFPMHYYNKLITILTTVCLAIHFQWNKYIFVWFSTRYRALQSCSLERKYINIFSKNCKIDNYVLTLLKMYWTTFSNTSGNVSKIVTNKNGAKFPLKYDDMYGNAHFNLW